MLVCVCVCVVWLSFIQWDNEITSAVQYVLESQVCVSHKEVYSTFGINSPVTRSLCPMQ